MLGRRKRDVLGCGKWHPLIPYSQILPSDLGMLSKLQREKTARLHIYLVVLQPHAVTITMVT
jgi:hypothetical protein